MYYPAMWCKMEVWIQTPKSKHLQCMCLNMSWITEVPI